ncbi:hypothetical protein J4Q44_G00392360 [Coregonus suidteri]|uniref:Uncharacterized protein n=1 Tax=Coregonus suidteri TaxID=861788 RepID=A0AAN8KPS7_9TELE
MEVATVPRTRRLLKEEDMTKIEFETSEEVDVTPTFDTMGLREDLLRGIYAYGRAGGLFGTVGPYRQIPKFREAIRNPTKGN